MEKVTVSDWRAVKARARAAGKGSASGVVDAKRGLLDAERGYRLGEIRKELGVTQQQLADALVVAQSRVSQIESADLSRAELATIRGYVEALGGSLSVVAEFGDTRTTLV